MKKLLFLMLLPVFLSGCAAGGVNIKSENQRFALMIQRFDFLRHHNIPKAATEHSKPAPQKNKRISSVSKTEYSNIAKVVVVKHLRPAVARIHGSTSGLPVLTVDFANKPLWGVLQDISNKTGYFFTTKGVNLGKKINLKGKYNLAQLLANLFAKDNTTLNLKTKKVEVK